MTIGKTVFWLKLYLDALFHRLEGTMNNFRNIKGKTCKKPFNISKMIVKIFIAFSKFYATHRNYEILSNS
jgi:hypothetical protein